MAIMGKKLPIKLGMVELIIEDNLIKEINYYIDSEARGSIIPENGYIVQAHGKACQDLLAFRAGDPIYLENHFEPDFNKHRIKTAISAGPRLLKDGEVFISSREEEFQADIAIGRAPVESCCGRKKQRTTANHSGIPTRACSASCDRGRAGRSQETGHAAHGLIYRRSAYGNAI